MQVLLWSIWTTTTRQTIKKTTLLCHCCSTVSITLWGFSQLWWKQTHQTWRAEWIEKLNQVSSLTYTCFHNIIGKSQAASFCNTFASAGIRNLEQGYGWALSIICSYLFTFLLKNNKGTLSEVACLYNEKSSSISEKLDVLQNKIFTVAF